MRCQWYMLYSFFMNHMNQRWKKVSCFQNDPNYTIKLLCFQGCYFFSFSTWHQLDHFFGLRLGGAHGGCPPQHNPGPWRIATRFRGVVVSPRWSLVDSMFVRKTYWISHIITNITITAQVYLMEHRFASKDHLWSLCSTIFRVAHHVCIANTWVYICIV